MQLHSVILPDGRELLATTITTAVDAGALAPAIQTAAVSAASAVVTQLATGLRSRLAPADAGKLAEYQLKERLAAGPAGDRSTAETEALTAEAQARGLTLAQLLTLIGQRADALSVATLKIAAWEAQQKAALAALPVPSDPTQIEPAITDALANAQASASALSAQLVAG